LPADGRNCPGSSALIHSRNKPADVALDFLPSNPARQAKIAYLATNAFHYPTPTTTQNRITIAPTIMASNTDADKIPIALSILQTLRM